MDLGGHTSHGAVRSKFRGNQSDVGLSCKPL